MRLVLSAMRAELFEFQPFRSRFLVLGTGIVPVFALGALKRDDFARHIGSFTR
jgi:hypothetical protein